MSSSVLTSSSTGTIGTETHTTGSNPGKDASSQGNYSKTIDEVKIRSNSGSDSGVYSCDSTGVKPTRYKKLYVFFYACV